MKINTILIILFLIITLFLLFTKIRIEGHDNGALIQLVAKDPQDAYLVGDSWKHYRKDYWYTYPYSYCNWKFYL
jgi:hypothetical protein